MVYQLMCTGQKPNTEVLTTLDPSLIAPNGRARVTRTLQLGSPASSQPDATGSLASQLDALQLDSQQPASSAYPQIFAAGDCADAFNALCAGHNAYYQGQLAARNVLRLARNQEKSDDDKEELEKYEPLPPAIKVSLGLVSVSIALSFIRACFFPFKRCSDFHRPESRSHAERERPNRHLRKGLHRPAVRAHVGVPRAQDHVRRRYEGLRSELGLTSMGGGDASLE